MSNKPIKTLNMSAKRADGTYIRLGNNATWGDDNYNWSLNVDSLRELLQLIDSGVIDTKKGYVGGKCAVFTNSDIPEVAIKQYELPIDNANFTGDNIPF